MDRPALVILLLKPLLQVLRVPLVMKFDLFDVELVPVVKLLNFPFFLPFLLLFVQTPLLLYLFVSVLLPPPQDRLFQPLLPFLEVKLQFLHPLQDFFLLLLVLKEEVSFDPFVLLDPPVFGLLPKLLIFPFERPLKLPLDLDELNQFAFVFLGKLYFNFGPISEGLFVSPESCLFDINGP